MEEKKLGFVCPRCQAVVDRLTKDHIIPKSFIGFAVGIGAIRAKDFHKKWAAYPVTQRICGDCNLKKGHSLMIDHPPTIDLLKTLTEYLQYQTRVADKWLAKNPSVPPPEKPAPFIPPKPKVQHTPKLLDTGDWRTWHGYAGS